ncbi:MAG: glycosyltransferase family 2 protein [Bacteroidetes bacterium]|nr:MAG: glycosyltransferase family 2 protein [Bacteroidota bacterium]
MDILIYILNIIQVIIYLYLAFATVYIFVFASAGLFYNEKTKLNNEKKRKFAVLIPGYKEDAVIVNVAKQALNQDYPKDKYEVIVIADSFSKKTLDALSKLPIRVVVVDFEISKKSKALNSCMDIIGDNYDVAFILDADNIMNSNVLAKINSAFECGFMAVQGHRTAKNLNSSFAILDALSEEINNNIFRKGHRTLGLSSALIGSGMGIDYQLYKKVMATVDSVGEDKEVELKLLKKKYKIEYINSALIYDEKTAQSKVFVNQRRRWIAAQVGFFRSHFKDGLKNFVTKGNIDYFDKVVQMIQPPRILLAGILTIFSLFSGLLLLPVLSFLQPYFIPHFTYWFVLYILIVISLIISIPREFYKIQTLKALFLVPKGFVLMLISLLKIKGANTKFIHTTHSHIEDNKNK